MTDRQAPISAYPLAWPEAWKRTSAGMRERVRFSFAHGALTIAQATQRLLDALRLLGVSDYNCIISSNLFLRSDGLPRSGQPEPDDPGAALYWTKSRGAARKVMAIDQYDRVADNIAALAATLNAMLAIKRYGGAEILDRSFMGFAALPAPTSRSWRQVLGFGEFEAVDITMVNSRFRDLYKIYHPEAGCDLERFREISEARDAAKRELS